MKYSETELNRGFAFPTEVLCVSLDTAFTLIKIAQFRGKRTHFIFLYKILSLLLPE